MANEHAFFYKSENGDRVYDDTSFEHWLKKFFTSGVFMNDLQVTANDDMTVTVGTGYVNADGKVKVYEESTTLQLETAGATYPRIDSIVLERNDTERDIILKVITGGYSSNPTAHLPVRQDGVYQLVIAQVLVSAGATKITQANITDTRAYENLCGMVTSAVDHMDYGQVQAQFDDWFAHVRGQLDEDAAGNLQNQVDTIKAEMLYRPNLLLNGDFQVNRKGRTTYTNEEAVDKWVCDANATLEVVEGGVILKGPSARLTQTLTGQVETGERHTITISVDGVPYSYNCKVYQNLEMASNVTDNVKVEINGTTMAIELIGECLDTTINYIRVDKGDVAYPHVKEDYEIALARCGVISNLSNPNLLINSDFRNPINSKGKTNYTHTHQREVDVDLITTIDKWQCNYKTVVNVGDDYVEMTSDPALNNWFYQDFKQPLKGTYTLTVNMKEVNGNFQVGVLNGTSWTLAVLKTGINTLTVTGNDIVRVGFYASKNGASGKIEWVKLEHGDIATPFVPRLHTEELLLCNDGIIGSNPNLLINGDFRVNQRGQTVYEYGSGTRYTIDRWQTLNSGKLEVLGSCIKLTNNSADGTEFSFRQLLETHLSGVYTLSVKVKSITGSWKTHCNYKNGMFDLQVGINTFSFDTSNGANVDRVQVYSLVKNSTIEIEWIKLEQGNIATPFVPRLIGEELHLCQRYYQVLQSTLPQLFHESCTANTTYIFVREALSPPMRSTPTVVKSDVYNHSSSRVAGVSNAQMTNDVVAYVKLDSSFATGRYFLYMVLDAEIYS